MDIEHNESSLRDAEELIWALLDEQISDADFQRLEAMLREDEKVRRLYVQCVQIHVDLYFSFSGVADGAPPAPLGAPVDLPLPSDGTAMIDPAF